MTTNEFTPINLQTVDQIPLLGNEPFAPSDLPSGHEIIEEVFHVPKNLSDLTDQGEVEKAKQASGMSDIELAKVVPALIADCLNEMQQYEVLSRKPVEERLEDLKKIAPDVRRIIDLSAPGDYYHLNKNDRYRNDPAMRGADRVRSDMAAKLAIVLAGIRAGWPDEELLPFLNEPILLNNNEKLNALRDKATQAVRDSGIRLVYSGRADEIKEIELVLNQKNVFIPKECVDFVGPECIENTVDQTREIKKYLERNLQPGESFIQPINLQGIRSMRMAKQYEMIPPETKAYVWAMPTATGNSAQEYQKKEVKGTVYYALSGQAAFEPATHTII